MTTHIGYSLDEIDTAAPTRAARLKWVIVVDAGLPPGRAANAAISVAAATATAVTGLLGPEALDADGEAHAGLPWAGCTVLAAPAPTLAEIRAKARRREDVHIADMPEAAQLTRVYDEFLDSVGASEAASLTYCAVSLVGPRNAVDKIVGRLPLMP